MAETISVSYVKELIKIRQRAKNNKDWKRADDIKNQLLGMGVEIKDYPDRTDWFFWTNKGRFSNSLVNSSMIFDFRCLSPIRMPSGSCVRLDLDDGLSKYFKDAGFYP
jgi:hypothetical protein